DILVDDGLFDDLTVIRASYGTCAKTLAALLEKAGIDPASCPARASLTPALRAGVDALVRKLEAAAGRANALPLSKQLAMSPTAVVGAEQILPILCFSMGIDPSLIDSGYARVQKINMRVIALTCAASRKKEIGDIEDLPV